MSLGFGFPLLKWRSRALHNIISTLQHHTTYAKIMKSKHTKTYKHSFSKRTNVILSIVQSALVKSIVIYGRNDRFYMIYRAFYIRMAVLGHFDLSPGYFAMYRYLYAAVLRRNVANEKIVLLA